MSSIRKILETDAAHRYSGITDDLYKLSDLRDDISCIDEPILYTDYAKLLTRCTNINDFCQRFRRKYRVLNVDLSGLLVAGGAVKGTLLNTTSKDIDVFVYGYKTIGAATARIERFIHDMYRHLDDIRSGKILEAELSSIEYDNNNDAASKHTNAVKMKLADTYTKDNTIFDSSANMTVDVIYNGSTITISIDGIQVQVIMRLYNTLSEILHGFDLGSSAVGYDGHQVYFTSLSKFCYENMVNIFDGTRRSTTYEYRLTKYFKDGFSIVLPDLDINRLRTEYFKYNLNEVCELPHLIFSYNNIEGNKIHVARFHNNFEAKSDYCADINVEEPFKIQYINLMHLINNTHKFIYTRTIKGHHSILVPFLLFDKTIIKYSFIDWLYEHARKALMRKVIDFSGIDRIFTVVNLKDIITKLYLENLSDSQKDSYIRGIITSQKIWIMQELEKIMADTTLKWVTENPTTQLTSSFNPIITDLSTWYGSYYITST